MVSKPTIPLRITANALFGYNIIASKNADGTLSAKGGPSGNVTLQMPSGQRTQFDTDGLPSVADSDNITDKKEQE